MNLQSVDNADTITPTSDLKEKINAKSRENQLKRHRNKLKFHNQGLHTDLFFILENLGHAYVPHHPEAAS